MPDFSLEEEQSGIIIGLDEVGRGPLAGPVVAAAVYIPSENRNHPVWKDVKDSKKLSAVKRDLLFSVIQGQCLFGIASASVEEIDSLNILQATFLAMERAVKKMHPHLNPLPSRERTLKPSPLVGEGWDEGEKEHPFILLIDGNRLPKNWPWDCRAIVKGDSKSVSIAAASILAKVTRDRLMAELATDYPHYGWDRNAGYGTAEHLAALTNHGLTPHHRRSFEPVKSLSHSKTT